MGRGRAKAKQTKVARDLKYRPMDTDFASLERELKGSEPSDPIIPPQYADLAGEYREDEFIDAYDVEDSDEDEDDDADERR